MRWSDQPEAVRKAAAERDASAVVSVHDAWVEAFANIPLSLRDQARFLAGHAWDVPTITLDFSVDEVEHALARRMTTPPLDPDVHDAEAETVRGLLHRVAALRKLRTGDPLSVPELAQLAGITPRSVSRAIEGGRLRPIRGTGAGRYAPYMVQAAEAQRWLDS